MTEYPALMFIKPMETTEEKNVYAKHIFFIKSYIIWYIYI